MPARGLNLYSEPYSPSGNMAANGVRKLLGAPRLDLLQTLVREAVQNCCDAAKFGIGPRVRFRLRKLLPPQLEALQSRVLSELPNHPETSAPIREMLVASEPWVLEICDFGTTGLAGPTRADVAAEDGEMTDFVNFIRDIGIKRDTDQGGGTYGFGKSALYLASKCNLIFVDTLTKCATTPVRRVIAAQLGETFVSSDDGERRRFTGRHWWGVVGAGDGCADPLEGEAAADLAADLGLPERSTGDTGTSIMILAPQFVDDNIDDVVGAIQEALLWNFWPRMMADVPPSRRLDVTIELDGEPRPIPAPEDTPPLDLFCDAMIGIRNGGSSAQPIRSQRPAATLGSLNIVKGLRGDRIHLRPDQETLFPVTCRHIAVMRPVELVVRYFDDGDPLPQPGFEWAGVFLASDNPEIEKAFADAEPPAHDDWQPDMLPKSSWARTYVRVALSRLRDAAQAVAGGHVPDNDGRRAGPSLGHVADLFGRALQSANGQGAGPPKGPTGGGGGGSGGGSTRRGYAISRPLFDRLEEVGHDALAIFTTEIRNDGQHDLLLRLQPSIVVDGGSSADFEEAMQPRVINVSSGAGSIPGADGTFDLGTTVGALTITIRLPEDGAVTVKAALARKPEQ